MSKTETRDELAKLTVDALRAKAKEKTIKGAWNMTKDQLLFELTKDAPKVAVAAPKATKVEKIKEPSVKTIKSTVTRSAKAQMPDRKPQNRRPQELAWAAAKSVDLAKLGLTPQALAICAIIEESKTVVRSDLIAKMPAKFTENKCETKQDPKHVLAYYLPTLKRHGLVTLNYAKTDGKV